MAAGKEIRTKIKSVQSTQKITKAMQMVATSKMRKTQDRMRQARPYAEKVREVMAHLAQATEKSASPYLRTPKEIKKVGVILITADKGLCGGLNTNSIKLFAEELSNFKDKNVEVTVCALGQKGMVAANRLKLDIMSSAVGLGDIPQMTKLIGPLSGVFKKFYEQELDAVYVLYSRFLNTMKQQATFEQLLPLNEHDLKIDSKYPWDYVYEPSAEEVLNELIPRYLESVIYQCVAENMASEQASRMIAMRAATDNAGEAIHQLSLVYNKSRQAAITKELAEICAGAAAV